MAQCKSARLRQTNLRINKVLNHLTAQDKIASYELFQLPPRWLFLRIETQRGVVGWGEPNLEGFSDTVSGAVQELMPLLIGLDPTDINRIWQTLYRSKFYAQGSAVIMSAMSGIDQALWDITGKIYKAPVHKLLVRRRWR